MNAFSKPFGAIACVGFFGLSFVFPVMASAQETPVPAANNSAAADAAQDVWPREIRGADGTSFTVHQPLFNEWDGFTLKGMMAVVVQPTPESPKTYGSLDLVMKTKSDEQANTVRFESIHIAKTNFPSAKNNAEAWAVELKTYLPRVFPEMPLDQVRDSVQANAAKNSVRGEVSNEPPKIIFSEKPALHIPIDGQPQWRKIDGTNLERALNTQVLLLRDGQRLFLHLWDGYVEAASLGGPWFVATNLPAGIAEAETQLGASRQVDLLVDDDDSDGTAASLKTSPLPEIIITTEPTEMVVSNGPLQWGPVNGTNLLYASNSQAHLFKDIGSQKNYLLVSGRWFVSDGTVKNAPWSYVSPNALPADFAKIPDGSPQETVKASVAGTPQAEEAAIANTIPEVVRVERETATMTTPPVYDGGSPKLVPIANTALFYAENSATPVISLNDTSWLACENGVWFSADSAFGPWRVAVVVPAEVYRIPYGSPLHYVSYVRVQRYNSSYVWFGYTPGYYGTVISSGGTVVYGTGYYYPAYVGTTVYVSYPMSYGYYFSPCWTFSSGWYFGFSLGWAGGWNSTYYRCRPPPPCWGPYRSNFYGPRPGGYYRDNFGPRHDPRRVVYSRMDNLRPPPREPGRITRNVSAPTFNNRAGRPVDMGRPTAPGNFNPRDVRRPDIRPTDGTRRARMLTPPDGTVRPDIRSNDDPAPRQRQLRTRVDGTHSPSTGERQRPVARPVRPISETPRSRGGDNSGNTIVPSRGDSSTAPVRSTEPRVEHPRNTDSGVVERRAAPTAPTPRIERTRPDPQQSRPVEQRREAPVPVAPSPPPPRRQEPRPVQENRPNVAPSVPAPAPAPTPSPSRGGDPGSDGSRDRRGSRGR